MKSLSASRIPVLTFLIMVWFLISGNKPVKTHHTYESQTVSNDQRKMVYAQRDSLLDTDDVSEIIADFHADNDGHR